MKNLSKIDKWILVIIAIVEIHSIASVIHYLMLSGITAFSKEMLIITIYPLIGLLAFLFNGESGSKKFLNIVFASIYMIAFLVLFVFGVGILLADSNAWSNVFIEIFQEFPLLFGPLLLSILFFKRKN